MVVGGAGEFGRGAGGGAGWAPWRRARSRWSSPSRAAAASVSAASRRLERDPAAEATARQPPQGQDALARFYDQQLTWSACRSFRCARLTVPLDYAKPGGATVSIAVLKAEATGTRRGSLVVNPGGPGGSGVQYAAAADFIVSKQVRDATTSSGSTPAGSAPPSP